MAGLTVVIATRNRWEELRTTLERLSELPQQPPVIVVDNGSSDGTAAGVRLLHPDVTVVALPANIGAAARNVGVRLAATPIVAFSDDDSWWDTDALSRSLELFGLDAQLGLVAGHILVGPHAKDDPTSLVMAAGPLDECLEPSSEGRRGVTGFLACAAIVRRSAFLATGGFETQLFIGGEEELLALDLADAGWKLVYDPDVVARHHPSPQRDISRRRRLLVRNRLLTGWLRFSGATALRLSARELKSSRCHRDRCQAMMAAGTHIAWALAHRRAVDRAVEQAFFPARRRH